jgi:DNA-binding CsgD family transcriptional regulator/predicted transcriptional regulator
LAQVVADILAMRRSQHAVLNLESPQVVETISEPFNCSVWEIVRRFGRPVILAEVAVVSHSTPIVVQAALERLEKLGLITRTPARGVRKLPTYKTNCDAFVVSFNSERSSEREAASAIKKRFTEHIRQIMAATQAKDSTGHSEPWSSTTCVPIQLTATDIAELSRIINVFNECIDRIRERSTKIDASESQDCNYLVNIEVHPTRAAVLPLPAMHIVPNHEVADTVTKVLSAPMNALSPREREVAIELARGRSRPEIASQLGVSINTIATIGKRIYAKLGVNRRAELAARVNSTARSSAE